MCPKPQDEISMHEADCPVELVTEGAQRRAGRLGGLGQVEIFNVVAVETRSTRRANHQKLVQSFSAILTCNQPSLEATQFSLAERGKKVLAS
jgi:hypothetical protein